MEKLILEIYLATIKSVEILPNFPLLESFKNFNGEFTLRVDLAWLTRLWLGCPKLHNKRSSVLNMTITIRAVSNASAAAAAL